MGSVRIPSITAFFPGLIFITFLAANIPRKKDINVACTSAYMPEPHEDTHTLVINYCGVYAERIEETITRIWEAVNEK